MTEWDGREGSTDLPVGNHFAGCWKIPEFGKIRLVEWCTGSYGEMSFTWSIRLRNVQRVMFSFVFRTEFFNRRLIAMIGAGLVCLLCEARSVEAACGDWLATHQEQTASQGEAGTLEVPASSCGCKGLRCRPKNSQGNLPDQVVRLLEGNWGVLSRSENPDVADRSFRLSDESMVYAISFAASIFHPPRSV